MPTRAQLGLGSSQGTSAKRILGKMKTKKIIQGNNGREIVMKYIRAAGIGGGGDTGLPLSALRHTERNII